ncbi:hypothetical protein [Planococcus soli]|uniref:hypothetical protein n=1 Tax=Planococcus soli TaxID=2666072 RepID=UPI001F4355C6|nr:hypothetical protein [Planococcus soli]
MSDFELVIHQETLETQKRYRNRKIHIEKRWRRFQDNMKGIFGGTKNTAAVGAK